MSAGADPPRPYLVPHSATRLDGEYYAACQRVFRACTDQGERMLAELERLVAGRKQLSILSVGAGTGLFEIPMLERLAEKGIRITHFVGIDIDRRASQSLQRRLKQRFGDHLSFQVVPRSFEDYRNSSPFDLVLFVHTFEYLTGDLHRWLERARNMLDTSGLLVLFSPQRGGINAVYEQVTQGPFSDDLEQLLEAAGIEHVARQVHAECNVSLLLEPNHPDHVSLLSFLTQVDCRWLAPEQRTEFVDYFTALADPKTAAVAHPTIAFVIEK